MQVESALGVEGDDVLYVGDHIYTDAALAKINFRCGTGVGAGVAMSLLQVVTGCYVSSKGLSRKTLHLLAAIHPSFSSTDPNPHLAAADWAAHR